VALLLVAPLGRPPCHPHQAGTGLLGDRHEPGRRPDTTAFSQRGDDLLRSGFGELGMEQGGATALGTRLSTAATAQQAETVLALHFPAHEVVRARLATPLACGLHTGERVQGGSLQVSRLAHRWLLSQALPPARHWLSTPLR